MIFHYGDFSSYVVAMLSLCEKQREARKRVLAEEICSHEDIGQHIYILFYLLIISVQVEVDIGAEHGSQSSATRYILIM